MPLKTVADILSINFSGPQKYRIECRVVDYKPDDIRDFTKRFCSTCLEGMENTDVKLCDKCGTQENEEDFFNYTWKFALLVEGRDGERMPVIVYGEKASELLNITPVK